MIKKRLLLGLLANIVWLAAFAQQGRHVILITIDGFRPDFYLENSWKTPNLHALLQEGVHAYGVNSVFPSMTYPSHTAIVTGVQPAKHGVFFNSMFERDSVTGKNYWNFQQITAPTIWEAADKAGLKVASLMWPVSVGAPASFLMADVGSKGTKVMEETTVPKGIADTFKRELFHSAGNIELGKDQNVARMAAWEIKTNKPNLMTIHFFSVDHAEHMVGRHGQMVEEAIADADSGVAIIRQAIHEAGLADSTLFIVAGDHGFYDVNTAVSPNIWLARAGLLDSVNYANWKARFHAVGGSAFLFLRDKNDKATLGKVIKLLESLPAEEKKYVRIVSRKEMDRIGADPNAAMAISALEGASFDSGSNGEPIRPGKGGAHGFFPDTRSIQTGFLAVGPGLGKGVEIHEMNLRDITAIMLKYLNLSMPSCEGVVPKEITGF